MKLKPVAFVDVPTPTGPMRTHMFAPSVERKVPAIILYSEIYQMTGPIARTAAYLSGHGFLVAVPEVYHEFAKPGEAFTYDQQGTDRGNALKTTKEISAFDSDSIALIEFLRDHSDCTGAIATMGICLGGHLAFRAATHPLVKAGVCLYATDIHKRSLGKGMNDNTLDRMLEIEGEMLMIWGRQDPHISGDGRKVIYDAMTNANVKFTWHEFNGEHAFIRDEGHRYDPALVSLIYPLVFDLLYRTL
jgi:carboxymethylenebutenolidase